jgi:arylsulfatase A-like enzyme/Flp pilus assembly protein TadD
MIQRAAPPESGPSPSLRSTGLLGVLVYASSPDLRAPRIRTTLRRLACAGCLAVTVVWMAGCGGGKSAGVGSFPGAPIVLISIDTLRSDHLPAYGYHGVETPAIDALRRDAVLFERSYSHVPLTLPSHCSILSGKLPADHGVRDNVGYRFDAAKQRSLPLVLRQGGYATGGAVSAYVLRGDTGVAQGFDFWDSQVEMQLAAGLGQSRRPGNETARLAIDWLRRVAAGEPRGGGAAKPFFLFLHLYEPHSPYAPPEPFASRYKASPYDGEIAAADAVVGDVIAELRRLGVYDRAVVLLLSDHGEGLGEHGEREHGLLLYRSTLQVPLLLKLPGGSLGGSSVASPAQLVDVYPTLLSLVGIAPPAGLPGRSLLELPRTAAGADRELYAETYYPRLHFGWSELTSLIRGRFHFIQGPDPELYDLAADAAELHQLRETERRTFADLRGRMKSYQGRLAAPAAVDPETARQLAALGYAGGTAQLGPGAPAVDPKSKIATLADLSLGMNLFFHQQYAQAVPAFRRAVAANPGMVDAWDHLGQSLEQLGRFDEALAAFEQAMRVSGGAPHIAVSTGSLLLRMGRLDEAQRHAELARKVSPAGAESLLAEIALARHQPAAAERAARAAVSAGGERMNPRLTLALALVAQGKLEEALRETDEVLAELGRRAAGQSLPRLWYVRGDIFARLQRDAEAEQAFLREIGSFPADVRTYSSLALLYASEGKPDAALAALRRMVESNGDSPAAYAEAVRTLRVLGDAPDAAALLRHALGRHPENPELRALAKSSQAG